MVNSYLKLCSYLRRLLLMSYRRFVSKLLKRRKIRLRLLLYVSILYILAVFLYIFSVVCHYDLSCGIGLKSRQHQWIPECRCHRRYFYYRDIQVRRFKSSCSDEGTSFRKNQKVISYSLYINPHGDTQGKTALYRQGIVENLQAMRIHYPGYTMRIYTDSPPTQADFCSLICSNSDLFWCSIEKTPSYGDQSRVHLMVWRFLPLGDFTVDHFLSRDLDSVLTEREAAVVKDWLNLPEKKPIHLMRDKAIVHNVPILGGTWGAKNSWFGTGNRDGVAKLIGDIIRKGTVNPFFFSLKGFDQDLLADYLYHPRKHQIVAYDSYNCRFWRKYTMVRPFPVRRKDTHSDFVGNTGLGRDKYDLKMCPVSCRPSYGKDWAYC